MGINSLLLIVVGISIAIMANLFYKKSFRIWKKDAQDFSVRDKIVFQFYTFVNMKLLVPNKYIRKAAIMHITKVYDYIAIKTPDLVKANKEMKANVDILDYWNSPKGRLFKIRITKPTENYEKQTIISLSEITKEAYKTTLEMDPAVKDENKKAKLTLVK